MSVSSEAARDSLLAWCQLTTNGAYQAPPHLKLLIQKLEAVERGEITRLLVVLPPEHGTSLTLSQKFPAWYLGRNPEKCVLTFAHSDGVAKGFGRSIRHDLVTFGADVHGIALSADPPSLQRLWLDGHRGRMTCAGVGSAIHGIGANLVIVDSPFMNWEQCQDPVVSERVWDWFRTAMHTRLVFRGACVVVAQAGMHKGDLGSRLLADYAHEHWEVLRLPCVAEDGDPLGRAPGELLWTERFNHDQLRKTRLNIGEQVWERLYQCRWVKD